MSWWRNSSIRLKASLGIGLLLFPLLVAVIIGISSYVQNELWKRETSAAENLNSIASALVSDAMMAGRKDIVQETIQHLGVNTGGQFDSIAIYDDEAILTTFATGFPGGRTIDRINYDVETTNPTCWVCHQLPASERPAMVTITIEGQKVLRSVVPLYNETRCQTCHGIGKSVLGDSIVDLRLDRYQQSSRTIILGLGGSMAVAVLIIAVALSQFSRRVVIDPLEELVSESQAITQGDLDRQTPVRSLDEIGQLGLAFNKMAAQLSGLIHTLEHRVEERTQSLQERSAYLESSAEVSRTLASILDKDELIRSSVEIIRERFDFYYVGLFLVDENNEWAVLQAGTGDAGQQMLANQHRLKIGEGMIGWSIANAQSRIALDIGEDAVRFENPLLPETRSEGALPLRSRGRVLGAVTIQSNQSAAFNQDIINTLQTMTDQIAITLDNADLLAQYETAVDAERRAYGDLRAQDWLNLSRQKLISRYVISPEGNLRVIDSQQPNKSLRALQSGQVVQKDGLTAILPVISHGHVIGGIKIRKPVGSQKWTQEQLDLLVALSEQLSIALENARMFEATQRGVLRERAISEISTEIVEKTEIDKIMAAVVSGLQKTLGASEVSFLLNNEEEQLQ